MTKSEMEKSIVEYLHDADKCISEDEEYIRGWKSALLVVLEMLTDEKGELHGKTVETSY